MKIIGLIGGISWVSTIDYYKIINQTINARLGDLNFSKCIIYSFNYADIKKNNDANDATVTASEIKKRNIKKVRVVGDKVYDGT